MRATTLICTIVLMAALATSANASIINVSVDGVVSWDGPGAGGNTILTVEVGQYTELTAISWDVGIESVGGSWLSEAVFSVDGGDGVVDFTVTPGTGDNFSGSMNYDSDGFIVLADVGIANVLLGDSNGDNSNDFTLEFYESFDDNSGAADAFWSNGTADTNPSGMGGLDFRAAGGPVIPEPSTLFIFGALSLIGTTIFSRRK